MDFSSDAAALLFGLFCAALIFAVVFSRVAYRRAILQCEYLELQIERLDFELERNGARKP